MADNTATDNEGLWFPDEVWITIASLLDNSDLARFRQLCSTTQFFGSEAFILQPHYNRLYAIDNTLPALLPQKGALAAFKQAFKKIRTRQEFEIDYLKGNCHVKTEHFKQVFKKNKKASLLSLLEVVNAELDKWNSDIIMGKIELTRSSLALDNAGITRFPVALFQNPSYAVFWKNLTSLTCTNNQLIELNLQALTALKRLYCNKNQIIKLNVHNSAELKALSCNYNRLTELTLPKSVALEYLDCSNNRVAKLSLQEFVALKFLFCNNNALTTLNLQGLAWLEELDCDNNPLTTLILTGVHATTKNKHAELERKLLFNKLSIAQSPQATQAIIRRLGSDYTLGNCFKYCTVHDAAKLFISNSANSISYFTSSTLSQISGFLPSFGATNNPTENTKNLKRKRDEEIDTEELSEESDNQPELKKRKKK